MGIRPRTTSGWHDYSQVFSDLRSGRLTYEEYDIMVGEDAIEMARRIDDAAEFNPDELKAEAARRYGVGRPDGKFGTVTGMCAPTFLGKEDLPQPKPKKPFHAVPGCNCNACENVRNQEVSKR